MQQVKLANGLLWSFNILLGVGVVIFAFNFLLFPKKNNDLGIDVDVDAPTQTGPSARLNFGAIATVQYPLTPASKNTSTGSEVRTAVGFPPVISMNGSMGETAFFDVAGDGAQADRRGPLVIHRRDGKEEQVEGWYLADFTSERAVFRNATTNQEHIVTAAAGTAGPTAGTDSRGGKNWSGVGYDAANFPKTRRVSQSPDREEWMVDPEEGNWLSANLDEELSRCQLATSASGGLEITGMPGGSIGALRGIQTGDVIKSVNGHTITTLADLKKIQSSSGRANAMSLVIDRAGRQVVIMYRTAR